MRIHNRVVIDIATGVILEDDFYDYQGQVAECGGGKGGGSQNSVTQTNLIPGYAQPSVVAYLAKMSELSQTGYETYTGETYAEQNNNEKDGIIALANIGRNPHAIITQGETYLRDTIDALKFGSNPKINEAYLKMASTIITFFEEDTLPRLHQEFNMSGNYGSDSHHWAQAKAAEELMAKLQDIGMDIYFKDYIEERRSQFGSLRAATEYGIQDALNAEILRTAGMYGREYRQGKLEDDYRKWRDEKEAIVRRLEILGNAVRSVVGSQVTETSPFYRPSTISQVAGLALAGVGLYGMMKGLKFGNTAMGEAGYGSKSLIPTGEA